MTHKELVERAAKWLKGRGCTVVATELHTNGQSGECPDAIGWRYHQSYVVECKASRADFLTDKNKRFRQNPPLGMGAKRFYMCPPEVILAREIPPGWGLLYVKPRKVEVIKESYNPSYEDTEAAHMLPYLQHRRRQDDAFPVHNEHEEKVVLLSVVRRLKGEYKPLARQTTFEVFPDTDEGPYRAVDGE